MRRLSLMTAVSLLLYAAAAVLFVWGLLNDGSPAAGRRQSGTPGPVVHISPGTVHVRVSPGNEIDAPLWALALLAGVTPPLIRDLNTRLRDRRRTAGLCPSCSYDLTGNVSGVCPECGKATNAA